MVLLENGKIETISYRNYQFFQQASFQVSSEGSSTGEWDRFDESKFFSCDSSQCFYVWDVSKGITPVYSNNHKQGNVKAITQSRHRASVVAIMNDSSQVNM